MSILPRSPCPRLIPAHASDLAGIPPRPAQAENLAQAAPRPRPAPPYGGRGCPHLAARHSGRNCSLTRAHGSCAPAAEPSTAVSSTDVPIPCGALLWRSRHPTPPRAVTASPLLPPSGPRCDDGRVMWGYGPPYPHG